MEHFQRRDALVRDVWPGLLRKFGHGSSAALRPDLSKGLPRSWTVSPSIHASFVPLVATRVVIQRASFDDGAECVVTLERCPLELDRCAGIN